MKEEQTTEDNRDLEGTDPVSTLGDEASTSDQVVENTEEAGSNSVPYDRFAQVNAQKNEAVRETEALKGKVVSMQEQLNALAVKNSDPNGDLGEMPEFDSVPDLVKYMDKRVEERVSQVLEPMQQQTKQANVASAIGQYFADNKDAAKIQTQMDDYTKTFSEGRRNSFVDAIGRGDTSVLDEVYYATAAKNRSQVQTQLNKQAQTEANTVSEPANFRSYPKKAPSAEDLIESAKKRNDFSDVWQNLAKKTYG